MAPHVVHCVVVENGSGDQVPWGVVSDLYLVAAAAMVRDLEEQTAGGSSASPVVLVTPEETLERAAQLMGERLPVSARRRRQLAAARRRAQHARHGVGAERRCLTVATVTGTSLFDRVVCGVDSSAAGTSAARAAAPPTAPEGSLTLVTFDDLSSRCTPGGPCRTSSRSLLRMRGRCLREGVPRLPRRTPLESMLVRGDPRQILLAELDRRQATLVAVGSHRLSRATGIALGAVSTSLLHEAPCAVLIARDPIELGSWPRSVVAGIDGSPGSAAALAAARTLSTRLRVPIRVIVATQHAHVDLGAAYRLAPDLEEHDARPLDALIVASESTDLVVVGSRGLRGIRALGSLSERLAHDARHSVLVVRPEVVP